VICALFVGWIVGKVGVMRWIGGSILPQDPESTGQSLRSFTIGFGALCLVLHGPGRRLRRLDAGRRVRSGRRGARVHHGVSPGKPNSRTAAAGCAAASRPPPVIPPTPPPPISGEPVVGFDLPPPVAGDLASFPRAAFRDRLAAFVLDVILVVLAQQILDLTRRDSAIFLLLLAYHIGFWTWKGTTVGGIICQLRLVRTDGSPLRFADALVRGLASIFSLAVLGLGGLWILKDPERQAWHDRIAGTYVVKVPRNWPL
jgi:uncharacterized RDD family membrane protein YckC